MIKGPAIRVTTKRLGTPLARQPWPDTRPGKSSHLLTCLLPGYTHHHDTDPRYTACLEEPVWREPDVFFNHYVAEGIVRAFPVETWCASSEFMHLFLSYLDQLTVWTASKLDPDWRNSDDLRRRHDRTNLNHWPMRLADLIARAAPYLPSDDVINRYLKPFSDARDDARS